MGGLLPNGDDVGGRSGCAILSPPDSPSPRPSCLQRTDRAAKIAAIPLTALILVVLLAACPGPAGPAGDAGVKGDKGNTGDKGDIGATGPTGKPGIDTLTERDTGKALVILINDGTSATNTAVIGTLPGPIDMSAQFRGGYAPIKYSHSMNPATNNTSTFEVDKLDPDTGMLTIKLRTASTTSTDNLYTISNPDAANANVITITATDAEGNEATKKVHILTNKKPTTPNIGTAWATNVGTEMRDKKEVVACLATLAEVNAANTIHQCTLTVALNSGDDFQDDGEIVLSVVSSSSKARVTVDKMKLTITGLASTWDKDQGGSGAHVPAKVTIRATDKGGLYSERTLSITVDSAPTVKKRIQPATIKIGATGTAQILARDVHTFFNDVETTLAASDLVTEVKSSDMNVATASITNDGLSVVPKNPGTTTLTVTIDETDGYQQKVSQTVTVTVER